MTTRNIDTQTVHCGEYYNQIIIGCVSDLQKGRTTNIKKKTLKQAKRVLEQYNKAYETHCLHCPTIGMTVWTPLLQGSLKQLVDEVHRREKAYLPPASIQSALESVKYQAAVDGLCNRVQKERIPKLKNALVVPLRNAEVWGCLLRRKLDAALQAEAPNPPRDHIICIGPGVDEYGYPTYLIEMLKVAPRNSLITVFDNQPEVLEGCRHFGDDYMQRALSLGAFLGNPETLPRGQFPYAELKEALLSPLNMQDGVTYTCHQFDFCQQSMQELPAMPLAKYMLGTNSIRYVTAAKKNEINTKYALHEKSSKADKQAAWDEYVIFARNLYTGYLHLLEDEGILFLESEAILTLMDQCTCTHMFEGYDKAFEEYLNRIMFPLRHVTVTLLDPPYQGPGYTVDKKKFEHAIWTFDPVAWQATALPQFPISAVTVFNNYKDS